MNIFFKQLILSFVLFSCGKLCARPILTNYLNTIEEYNSQTRYTYGKQNSLDNKINALLKSNIPPTKYEILVALRQSRRISMATILKLFNACEEKFGSDKKEDTIATEYIIDFDEGTIDTQIMTEVSLWGEFKLFAKAISKGLFPTKDDCYFYNLNSGYSLPIQPYAMAQALKRGHLGQFFSLLCKKRKCRRKRA